LGQLNIQHNRKIITLAYTSPEKGFVFNPDKNIQLNQEDCLILMGDPEHLNNFKKTYTIEA
jgi:uncharacterized protein with PhoU and TrkA domain